MVDLNTMDRRRRVEDLRRRAAAAREADYTGDPESISLTGAQDLKPLEIVQREGPSFTVDGYEPRLAKVGRSASASPPREGLVLHTRIAVRTTGPITPSAPSLSEMFVPYGDPAERALPQAGPRQGRVRHWHAG